MDLSFQSGGSSQLSVLGIGCCAANQPRGTPRPFHRVANGSPAAGLSIRKREDDTHVCSRIPTRPREPHVNGRSASATNSPDGASCREQQATRARVGHEKGRRQGSQRQLQETGGILLGCKRFGHSTVVGLVTRSLQASREFCRSRSTPRVERCDESDEIERDLRYAHAWATCASTARACAQTARRRFRRA